MDMQILRPSHDSLEIKGKISYSEGARAWNIIRLKKELLQEFPQLNEKRASFSYKIMLFKSYKNMEKALEEMQKKDNPLPLLLFFYREKVKEQS